MITGQPVFNHADKLLAAYNGKIISIDEINALSPGNGVFEEVFKFQARLQNLNLTEKEIAILAAMCIMSTGTWCLDPPMLVV